MNNIYNPKLSEVVLEDIIGLDSEFNVLDTLEADCLVLSINNPGRQQNYAIACNKYSQEELAEFCQRLTKCKVIIAHNAKVEIGVIKSNFGILLRNCFCTMIASQIVDNGFGIKIKKEKLVGTQFEGVDNVWITKNMVGGIHMMQSPHGLLGTIRRYLGVEVKDNNTKKRLQMSFVGLSKNKEITEEQLEYACSDVNYLYPLYLKQLEYINHKGLGNQIICENKLTPVLVKMEHKGCLVDQGQHKDNIKAWKEKLFETELKMDEEIRALGKDYIKIRGGMFANQRRREEVQVLDIFGGVSKVIENENRGNINYSSSKQIEDIFTRLELPKPTDDAGKITFGEEALNMYITSYPESILRQFLELLLDYREYSKLLSTYGQNIFHLLDKNGRMRTNYTQAFTNTLRLTSSAVIKDKLGLNLANIPQKAEMRAIFIPDKNYSFVDCDLTGQEVALVASYSKEPVLLKALKEGFDHHSFLSSKSYSIIFDKEVEILNSDDIIKVGDKEYKSKKLRNDHKSALFSCIYLGGPKRIQNVLNEYICNHKRPEERYNTAQRCHAAIKKALPKMFKFLENEVDFCGKNGYVVTHKWGARRNFEEPEKAYGDAANFKIQASGAQSIKVALVNLDMWLEKKSKELGISEEELGWITLTVYDQNLLCINNKYLEYAPEIQEIMAKSLTYFLDDLQGSSDCKITTKWEK